MKVMKIYGISIKVGINKIFQVKASEPGILECYATLLSNEFQLFLDIPKRPQSMLARPDFLFTFNGSIVDFNFFTTSQRR